MSELVRFGVSLDKYLLSRFDELIQAQNYTNRSEAIRDLIREKLVEEQWKHGGMVAGAVTLIYDHHQRDLLSRITDIQHDYQKMIISTQHIHLDHNHCLEVIAVRGVAQNVLKLAYSLRSIKGVRHGTLSMSSTGREIW
jgi:CopG family nickel-responsive transcriptional regulator